MKIWNFGPFTLQSLGWKVTKETEQMFKKTDGNFHNSYFQDLIVMLFSFVPSITQNVYLCNVTAGRLTIKKSIEKTKILFIGFLVVIQKFSKHIIS